MVRYRRLYGVNTLLQSFRLSHAISEAGVPLAVHPSHRDRYLWLDRYFPGLNWKATLVALPFRDVTLDHRTPSTSLGNVQRPLIFAHSVIDRCRDKWSDRTYLISFAGRMTEARRKAFSPVIGMVGDAFRVVETNAGRTWPTKAWDDAYYEVLGRSQLTACPDGDFIWTYRFFEAALCGSIPVVQNWCSQFEGFRFYRMADYDPATMQWREDWALENAIAARQLLTVPHECIRHALRMRR